MGRDVNILDDGIIILDPAVERVPESVPRAVRQVATRRRSWSATTGYNAVGVGRHAERARGRCGHRPAGGVSDAQDRGPRQTLARSAKRQTARSRIMDKSKNVRLEVRGWRAAQGSADATDAVRPQPRFAGCARP
jgi:hypothetical protein